jgi:two-component system, NarL family, response regulator NreC
MSELLQLRHRLADPGERPQAEAIRVLLADDHAAVRRSMRLLLDCEDDLDVIAEATDLSTVIRHVNGHVPHVMVLDLQMPNGSSMEMIRRLRARLPDTGIIVLTMEESPAFAQAAIDAGALGFVLKHMADTELATAVRLAAKGQRYISPHVAARLGWLRRAIDNDGLSSRETEVLRLIALGYTSAEIARTLHLSRRTVDSHRARIHRKLGLKTRAQLVRYATQAGVAGDRPGGQLLVAR